METAEILVRRGRARSRAVDKLKELLPEPFDQFQLFRFVQLCEAMENKESHLSREYWACQNYLIYRGYGDRVETIKKAVASRAWQGITMLDRLVKSGVLPG